MSGSTPVTEFGARLRQAREQRGISLRQIASATKIAVVALEALERGQVSKLPGGIFSRAFVRSYAQEVGLEAEQTVRDFLAAFPDDTVTAGSPLVVQQDRDSEEGVFESRQRMALTLFKLVLVSVPIGILLIYVSTRGNKLAPAPQNPAPRPAAVSPPPPAAPAVPAVPAGGDQAQAGAPPAREAAAASDQAFVQPNDGSLRLEIAPTANCWVSLTVDGTLVLARVMQPGERVVRRVQTDAVIQVGDAGAFTFSINGRPGRPLGESGQVRTVRVTPDNAQTLVR
jgi:cytoskeletal protein RodZ